MNLSMPKMDAGKLAGGLDLKISPESTEAMTKAPTRVMSSAFFASAKPVKTLSLKENKYIEYCRTYAAMAYDKAHDKDEGGFDQGSYDKRLKAMKDRAKADGVNHKELTIWQVDSTRVITCIGKVPHPKGEKEFFIVSWRGTVTKEDMMHDALSMGITLAYGSDEKKLGIVALGFEPPYNLMQPQKKSDAYRITDGAYNGEKNLIKEIVRQHKNGLPILCTGHSLGGALATITTADLMINMKIPCKTITYGSPRALGVDLADKLQKLKGYEHYRCMNMNDPIPLAPPSFLGLHKHTGKSCALQPILSTDEWLEKNGTENLAWLEYDHQDYHGDFQELIKELISGFKPDPKKFQESLDNLWKTSKAYVGAHMIKEMMDEYPEFTYCDKNKLALTSCTKLPDYANIELKAKPAMKLEMPEMKMPEIPKVEMPAACGCLGGPPPEGDASKKYEEGDEEGKKKEDKKE